jgi:hypothetical protein
MTVFYFFRDQLTIDGTILDQWSAQNPDQPQPVAGDTLVLGGAQCQLQSLSSDFDYVIMADSLATAPVIQVSPATGRSVAIYAQAITTPLRLDLPGIPGADGRPGTPGRDGELVTVNNKPHRLPGGNGGDGSNGSPGGSGGSATICYAASTPAPTASAPGGPGSAGGPGGAGGSGNPPGASGRSGRNGHPGADGPITISTAPPDQVYQAITAEAATGWAQYRTDVGQYLFRLFDPASQLHALSEFTVALALDPANPTAALLLQRLISQETPGGTARDLDIAPDVQDIAAGLLGETQLVLSDFLALEATMTAAQTTAAMQDQMQLDVTQLSDRLSEALLDVITAQDGVQAANSERGMYDAEWSSLQQQIFALQDQPLSLTDLLTTLGAAAAGIAGLVTGVGAIVSIPAALAVLGSPQAGITQVLKFLQSGKKLSDDKSLGGDLSDLLKGGSAALTSFGKVSAELSGSASDSAVTQLAMQQATVAMQDMVAQLRQQQSADQLAAAQARVTDATAEVQAAQAMLQNWQADESFLDQAMDQLLTVARALAAMVSEAFFLARRALEVYQLEDASDVHFDYGFLHPDIDNSYVSQPLYRVQQSLESVTQLPSDVITWNQIFVAANDAQIAGYDVVHPTLQVTISDPAALAQLGSGGALRFSVGIGPDPAAGSLPADIYLLRVDTLSLTLTGATASGEALVWVQHDGHWLMRRPPTIDQPQPPDIEFSLLRHVEAFNFAAGSDPSAVIPAEPQASAEPGPPFSFWGRGALADWTLFADPSATALDLAALSEVQLSIGCIGTVAQGAVTPPIIQISPTARPVAVPPSAAVRNAASNATSQAG